MRTGRRAPLPLPLLLLAIVGTACSAPGQPASSAAASATASATPAQTAAGTPTGSARPSSEGTGDVIVTFRTSGEEEFRILLTDEVDIEMAEALLSGEEEGAFPNGLVVRGDDGGVNVGYSWHIDPDSVEFAEMSTEVCDGNPSDVEAGTITSDRFCPWSAVVVAIEPAD